MLKKTEFSLENVQIKKSIKKHPCIIKFKKSKNIDFSKIIKFLQIILKITQFFLKLIFNS